jgi:hypothetical protein
VWRYSQKTEPSSFISFTKLDVIVLSISARLMACHRTFFPKYWYMAFTKMGGSARQLRQQFCQHQSNVRHLLHIIQRRGRGEIATKQGSLIPPGQKPSFIRG